MKKVLLGGADNAIPKKKQRNDSSTVPKAGADEIPVVAAAGSAAALPTAAAASAQPEACETPTRVSAEDAVDWRQRCIERFHLKPLPNEWLVNAATKKYIEALSLSDNACWKRYFEFRTKRHLRADKPRDDNDSA